MAANKELGICSRCNRPLALESNFYKLANGNRMDICKLCLTAHIDNFDPTTYEWVLKTIDVPYVPQEWQVLLDRALAKDPTGSKLTGTSILGRYLSKMKLKQYAGMTYADSEKIIADFEEKKKSAKNAQVEDIEARNQMLKEQLDKGEITESEYKTYVAEKPEDLYGSPNTADLIHGGGMNFFDEREFAQEDLIPDVTADLTEEDKKYLALKWGTLYKPREWIDLENHYTKMTESFDIQDADTESALLLICKTYLKMNQALDMGDFESYKKLSAVYDSLRKSAKFTALQNKETKQNEFDALGNLVLLCEKEEGFIPRFATDVPQDAIDVSIQDNKQYLYNLVTTEMGLGQQIEDAIKKIQIQEELEKEENILSEEDVGLTDKDFEEYFEDLEEQRDLDDEAGDE